jgi:hypothetical protein
MVSHRIKKVIAWVVTFGILALMVGGILYAVEVL